MVYLNIPHLAPGWLQFSFRNSHLVIVYFTDIIVYGIWLVTFEKDRGMVEIIYWDESIAIAFINYNTFKKKTKDTFFLISSDFLEYCLGAV